MTPDTIPLVLCYYQPCNPWEDGLGIMHVEWFQVGQDGSVRHAWLAAPLILYHGAIPTTQVLDMPLKCILAMEGTYAAWARQDPTHEGDSDAASGPFA